jgi:hypothetical protein
MVKREVDSLDRDRAMGLGLFGRELTECGGQPPAPIRPITAGQETLHSRYGFVSNIGHVLLAERIQNSDHKITSLLGRSMTYFLDKEHQPIVRSARHWSSRIIGNV